MSFARIREARGDTVGPPYARTLKVILSPQVGGVEALTFLISILHPGSRTSLHHHDESGELMYFLTGRGKGVLGDCTYEIEPDTALYAPPGIEHQILNSSDETMKIACVYVPPVPADYVELAVRAALADAERARGL